ncbi:MAG: ATP cone domain-containing protein [Halanaerobiales bacterium]
MKVIKRNGAIVDYSRDKISNAIYRAMMESGQNAGREDAEKVALAVEEK